MRQLYRFCTETILKSKVQFKETNFVDRMKVYVKAGDGGKGCVCWYRDRMIVSGAPDGGDGGKGGDVYFKASNNLSDLSMFKRPHIKGNDGKSGAKEKRNGRIGSDIHIQVPIGTLIFEMKDDHKKLIADLDFQTKQVLVARGGKGGPGNGKHVGIREVQAGEQGQQKELFLEMKTIADIGLVGFPNAGKSTLLASASRALPKIADYPFTTLTPTVGRIEFIDNFEMTMADIPGLIEDAHLNKGLGHEFLRHIERCKVLLYVLDGTTDVEHQLEILKKEVGEYNKEILKRPYLVVVNKVDLYQHDKYIGVSAKHGLNIGNLLLECKTIISEVREKDRLIEQKKFEEERLSQARRQYLEKELFA